MGIIKSQSACIATCWRQTFCDSSMCLPIFIFWIPLKMENMQCLYWGQGFREAFAWQMIELQFATPAYISSVMLGRSQIEVWRTWCQWVNWPREITAIQGFNQCRLPCICTYTPTRQAYSLTTSHFHQSLMYVLAYYEFPYGVKKDTMAWTCHFSLNSKTKVSGGGVWDPDQLVHLRNRGLVILFTCFTHVSMPTLHASGRQLLYFRWGVKNDCQQLQ